MATIKDFIEKITIDQFYSWWNNTSEKDVPQKVLNMTEKYYLLKSNKKLPFKWVVFELAKLYNLDLQNFGSSTNTRDSICVAYDFEIFEEITFNQTEYSVFEKHYKSKISKILVFQEFISFSNLVVNEININAYKMRTSIGANQDIMLLLGMKIMLNYKEINQNVEVGFIVSKEFVNTKNYKLVSKPYEYKGTHKNCFITFSIQNWNEIPMEVLEENKRMIAIEYEVFKNNKRSVWNEEANTTNNVIKYLVFNKAIFENIKTENNLQKDYNKFISNSNIHNWDWYKSLKKYSEILKDIKILVVENKFSTYLELNNEYLRLSNDDVDFLERYLFKQENGISDIGQGSIFNWKRDEILNEINKSPEVLFNIIKATNAQDCFDILLPLIYDDKNKFAVAYRFTRTLFPYEFTSVDATGKFNGLLKKLKNDYQIILSQKKQIPQNKEIVDLITSDDVYAKQIFFWELLNEEDIDNFSRKNQKEINNKMTIPLNQILYGPPGTGKTYNTINKALEILDFDMKNKSREEIKKVFETYVKEGRIVFTTFHQSMSYEDFIEGIKPRTIGEKVVYEIQDGICKNISTIAKSNYESSKKENKGKLSFEVAFNKLQNDLELNPKTKFPLKTPGYEFTITGFTDYSIQFEKANGSNSHTLSINTLRELYYGKEIKFNQGVGIYYPSVLDKLKSYNTNSELIEQQNYVIIIDEINRGNVSQIFGELITLIEDDKRIGENEELFISLPYNKTESFGVPPNLYIIGTMNTADRSVEALDTALRRRFVFEEMNAQPELIATDGKSKETNGVVEGINLVQLLFKINARIEKLFDKDHQIGHAFFMSVSSKPELDILFKNKIIPLLQEYFYGDFGKIGLVLGESFIELETQKTDFASFKHYDDSIKRDYQDKKSFKFTDKVNWDYISIYTNSND